MSPVHYTGSWVGGWVGGGGTKHVDRLSELLLIYPASSSPHRCTNLEGCANVLWILLTWPHMFYLCYCSGALSLLQVLAGCQGCSTSTACHVLGECHAPPPPPPYSSPETHAFGSLWQSFLSNFHVKCLKWVNKRTPMFKFWKIYLPCNVHEIEQQAFSTF